jgi:hypothetical protein
MSDTPIFNELQARKLDELDELVQRVRACLSDELLKPDQRKRERRTASAGHCYIASEALWHLTDRKLSVFHMTHEDNSHWFLCDVASGRIVDATADQFATPPPYGEARHSSFMTNAPSKRTRELLRRVAELS